MIFLYNTSTKEISGKSEKLSKQESKFLELLISYDIVTYDILIKNGFTYKSIRVVKNRLLQKTFLNIKTVANVGYRLDDKIYII